MKTKQDIRDEVIARRDGIDPAWREKRSVIAGRQLFGHLEAALAAARAAVRGAWTDEAARAVKDEAADTGAPLVGVYSALGSEVSLARFYKLAGKAGWRLAFPVMIKNPGSTLAISNAHMEFYLQKEKDTGAGCASAAAGASSGLASVTDADGATDAGAAPFLVRPARAIAEDDPSLATWRHVEPAELDAVVVPMVAFDERLMRLGYGGGNYDRLLEQLRKDAVVVGIAFDEQKVDEVPTEPHDKTLPAIILA